MNLIQDENQWMEERGMDMESGLSQVPAQCDCSAPAITDASLDIIEKWLATWCEGSFARSEGLGPINLLRHKRYGLVAFEQEQNNRGASV